MVHYGSFSVFLKQSIPFYIECPEQGATKGGFLVAVRIGNSYCVCALFESRPEHLPTVAVLLSSFRHPTTKYLPNFTRRCDVSSVDSVVKWPNIYRRSRNNLDIMACDGFHCGAVSLDINHFSRSPDTSELIFSRRNNEECRLLVYYDAV
jgi:hypothetical protein